MMVVLVWVQIGYPVVIFMAALQRVDPELYEAAELEHYRPTVVHVDRTNQPIDELTAELIASEQQGPAPHRYVEVD